MKNHALLAAVLRTPTKTFAGKDGEKFYLLAGRYSQARATKISETHWVVSGHLAGGESVDPLICKGDDADDVAARAYHAARRLAFHDERPVPLVSRTGTTQRGLQAVEIRKVG